MHFLALLIHLFFLPYVLCNTEIVNFSVQDMRSLDLPFTQSWPTLHSGYPILQWNASLAESASFSPEICPTIARWSPDNLSPCLHELWLVLDLDAAEWQNFDKFTLRVSWPAYYPTTISMSIFEPNSLASFVEPPESSKPHRTRRRYARIQAAYTGILSPGSSDEFDPLSYYQVPILLKLEPLYFGALPQSVIPIIYAIAGIIILGYPAANQLTKVMQKLVERDSYKKSTPAKIN